MDSLLFAPSIHTFYSHLPCMAGDAVLMDSRLWHCGGANASGRRRSLLFSSPASLLEPLRLCLLPPGSSFHALLSAIRRSLLVASFLAERGQPPYGSSYSLLEELEGRHTVDSLRVRAT